MSNTKSPRTCTHPLDGWVEVFRSGTHTDASGQTVAFTEADLDSMVAQHAVQAAPAVIGHPEHNDPAVGWVSGVKRVGAKLYAQFKDWAPEFVKAVEGGAYRNRSVKIVKGPAGWRIDHVAWLGAKLPAVHGMAALYHAPAATLQTVLFHATAAVADPAQPNIPNQPQPPATGVPMPAPTNIPAPAVPAAPAPAPAPAATFSQADIDAAIAKATAAADAAKLQFAQEAQAAKDQLAKLQADASAAKITAQVEGWLKEGRITPAQKAETTAFMQSISGVQSFEFAQADGSKKALSPADYFVQFMSAQKPAVKLADGSVNTGSGSAYSASTDPAAIHTEAQRYMKKQSAEGVIVPLHVAIDYVTKAAQ